MRKNFPRCVAIIFLALCAPAGRADVVVLKGGEKIEGRITSETPAEVRIEVKVSASIVDERVIPRADVARIEKVAPDEMAWATLKAIQPGANSLPAAQYEQVLAPLKAFAAQYPQSAHRADVQKTVTTFEEEKKRVDAGELKLDGNWLNKEEAQKERYQINGMVTLNYIRSEQARGDIISALNAFDLLEKQFPNSKSFPDAVELAIKMLTPLKAQAAARVAAIPAEKAAQEKVITAALEPSKSDMRAAAERAKAASDAAVAATQQKGLKWPPYLPKSELAMKQIADKAGADLTRLAAIDLAKIRQSIELSDKAKQAITAKDFANAEEMLKKAGALWEANEILPRITADLAAAKLVAKPAATPAPATPKPVAKRPDVVMPADEPPPGNPWLKIVLGVLAIALVAFGWRVYKSVKTKANEVLE